ncbi:hypothetical protein JQ631_28560 [Bradyrhizobium manausense]|uniref:hypothetical protein n=1 Tax=Bradyrhizobium manausense TaxID=989370 RepID=UPI001BAE5337|nr:hypothetical protein [Bradyrhizobium manausense]MBR0793044.1 hypothetical protein [Bradyrhizobium manausense]
MIILDPAQALALRKSLSGPVEVTGRGGTGKSVLANVIASETARSGKRCLLVGASHILERPLGFGFVREIHRILSDRTRLDYAHGPAGAVTPPPSAVEARIRSNPEAARAAALILGKAQEIAKAHNLSLDEIEGSAAAGRGPSASAVTTLSLAAQDASRLANVLWTGNARAGRTFKDVDSVIAGGAVEVPPDDEVLGLILSSDRDYEAGLAKIVLEQQEADEESSVSKSVASLLRPRSSDQTIAEYQRHAAFMARTISAAISLIRRHGSLTAALAASNGNDASKAIEYFMRMRPDQAASAAVRTFEAALQDYRHDSALLEPLLPQFGSRRIGSFSVSPASQSRTRPDVGKLIQMLREARYASKHLHGHLATLRASLPKTIFERLLSTPIEDASTVLSTTGGPDPRSKAADEARQLRELFTSTGFGDPFNAPDDFVQQVERISGDPKQADDPPSSTSYSPGVLDLLLDLTALTNREGSAEWPSAVTLAKTPEEARTAIADGKFDVVVIDDASSFPSELLRQIEATRPIVHSLGVDEHDGTTSLEIPHRQVDADVAAAATGAPNRWLGQPNGFGVLVRAEHDLTIDDLSASAGLLAMALREQGCGASAFGDKPADVVIGAFDELDDAGLAALAERAGRGVVALCRKDARSSSASAILPQSADVHAAQALGWKIERASAEGTALEKDGRLAVLVDERAVLSSHDETVSDVVRRLKELGWDPIVAWNETERDRSELVQLLTTRARPSVENHFRKFAQEFDLKPTPSPGGGPGADRADDATASATISGPETQASTGNEAAAPEVTGAIEADLPTADDRLATTPLDPLPHAADDTPATSPDETQQFAERESASAEGPARQTEKAGAVEAEAQVESDDGTPTPAPSRPQAVFRDRRGSQRPAAQKDTDEPRRERRTARVRQTDARLRLIVDPIRKRVALAVVPLKPEGFPEEANIEGSSVLACGDTRYDDIDLQWTNGLLDCEFRLKDEMQQLEWIRGARRFHLFTALSGEPDLMSISAAPLAGNCVIVCRERDVEAITTTAAQTGSPGLVQLANYEGIPSEWVVLEGYSPVQALSDPPEWLKPLDPGASIDITFSDGIEIRSATYAEGGAPLIRISGMPENCQVFIDDAQAEKQNDESWIAPGWDTPGQHRVIVIPGSSRSYNILSDPALGGGWEPWIAHDALSPIVAGSAGVCGAMVYCPDGRTVLATQPASSVTALGSQHEIQSLARRKDAPAALAVLSFDPLFAVLSSGGRRGNNTILALDSPGASITHKPRKRDDRWVATIRDMAARRVPIRPETAAAKAAWRSITKEARRWRRIR